MSEAVTPAASDHSEVNFEDAVEANNEPQDQATERRSRSSASTRSLTDSPSSRSVERKASEGAEEPIPEEQATPRMPTSSSQLKSPAMTARHAKNPSTTSFAEVHLGEDGSEPASAMETVKETTTRGRQDSEATAPSPKSTTRSQSRQSQMSQHSTSSRPSSNRSSVPTSASAMAPPPKPMPQPQRTFSSPFNWFQRKKTASTASIPTTPLLATRNSNGPEFRLDGLGEERMKESLKERFKQLRMKEEAGIEIQKVASPGGVSPAGLGIDTSVGGAAATADDNASVKSPAPSVDRDSVVSYTTTNRRPSSASTVDPSLAPGTVSGASTGPSAMADPAAPIDWDLWQNVVNEGPSAVAKSTPAELNRAIASGIPATIRGVVWQVFAQSEDKGLEQKYWELVAKGTDKELATSPSPAVSPGTALPTPSDEPNSSGAPPPHKDSITSESSSVHSDEASTPGTNGVTSPSGLEVPHMDPKAQVEQAKRAKEDLAALKRLEKTIRKDMGSRSNYSRYATAQDLQDGLFNVCKAYALYDVDVGYAQGMNFIVMPLLFNMPQEEAFCLLVRLMHHYKVRDMFIQDMPGLHVHIEQFSRLLDDMEPALAHHMRKRGILPSLYATQWFLTLFAYRFPLQLVLRIYDLVLSEGFESAILKFALALMRKNATQLLEIKDMGKLKTFLNEKLFDVYIDHDPSKSSVLESGFFGFAGSTGVDRDVYRADLLVQDACAISIDSKELELIAREFTSKTKYDRTREEETERIRKEHGQLSTRVKQLEKNAQKTDADHVELTGQMIRSKMDNEELRQQNADLETELHQLKLSLSAMPAEIEKGLKDDIDSTKKRISEVVEQNRLLEDQMKEMEGMLVAKNMEWANLNSEYETLKQKWSDLKRALGD